MPRPYSPALTILVVDLDIAYQLWLTELLIDAGYRVLPALSAAQASGLIAESGFTIAALVINPEQSGTVALARNVRRHQPALRVVAALDSPVTDESLPSGVDAVVVKPGRESDLTALGSEVVKTIRALLAN